MIDTFKLLPWRNNTLPTGNYVLAGISQHQKTVTIGDSTYCITITIAQYCNLNRLNKSLVAACQMLLDWLTEGRVSDGE